MAPHSCGRRSPVNQWHETLKSEFSGHWSPRTFVLCFGLLLNVLNRSWLFSVVRAWTGFINKDQFARQLQISKTSELCFPFCIVTARKHSFQCRINYALTPAVLPEFIRWTYGLSVSTYWRMTLAFADGFFFATKIIGEKILLFFLW